MNTSYRWLPVALIAASGFLAGCAGGPGLGGRPLSTGGATGGLVPALNVVTACGGCDVPADVPALVKEGYAQAAADAGAKISTTDTATLTIKELSYRSTGARAMAGAFAGKDEIKAQVVARNKKFEVEDYYRNAWQGIGALARKIGSMAFEGMK